MFFDFIIEDKELLKALKLDEKRMRITNAYVRMDSNGCNFVKFLIEFVR